MTYREQHLCLGAIVLCLLPATVSSGGNAKASETDKLEYKQERARIKVLRDSLSQRRDNDLKAYEKFADELKNKWSRRNKELSALLVLDVCGPLSSGSFSDRRQYDVARRYALSALSEPNEIPLEVELELIGHVMTDTIIPRAPKGQQLAQRRRTDVKVRLHAWKRLTDAIDPNWDPNEVIWSPNVVGASVGIPFGGMAPESVKDPNLRARYEAALRENEEKRKRHGQQRRLRKWLRRFPPRAEKYITRLYSAPPFNSEELQQYLDKYLADKKTKDRILDTVKKNIEKQTEKTPNGQ